MRHRIHDEGIARSRPSAIARRAWTIATTTLVLAAVGSDVLFVFKDPRVPVDPGRYYLSVPEFYWSLGHPLDALIALPSAVLEPTGWYQWAIAVVLRIFGRNPRVFALLGAFWLAVILGATARVARRLGGTAAGFAAVALVVATPTVTIFARTSWLHVPEAALSTALLAVFAADVKLSRWRTVAVMAVLGVLIMQLRESGLVWVGSLVPLVLWGAFPRDRSAWRRLLMLGAAWFLGTIPALIHIRSYLLGKFGARARYVLATPPLAQQYLESLATPVAIVVAVGMACFLLRLRSRWKDRQVEVALVAWGLMPILLFAIFHASFTNYTPYVPAVAIAAAVGLTSVHPFMALVPLVVLCNLCRGWIPVRRPVDLGPNGRPMLPGKYAMPMRPWVGWSSADISRLLDATCTSNGWHTCHVVVEQGLWQPSMEEYGLLGLFLLAEDRVELRTVYDVPKAGWERYDIDALALFYCGADDDGFRRRAPDSGIRALQLIQSHGLAVSWADKVDAKCAFYWLTPYGKLARPDLAPKPWFAQYAPRFSVDGYLREIEFFQQRNPQFAHRLGHASEYLADLRLQELPPRGWNAAEVARLRVRAAQGIRASSDRARAELRAPASTTAQMKPPPR